MANNLESTPPPSSTENREQAINGATQAQLQMAHDMAAMTRIRQLEGSPDSPNHMKRLIIKIADRLRGTGDYITDQYRRAVKRGRLACALFVTEVLRQAGVLNENILTVDGTVEELKNLGWKTHPSPTKPEGGWIVVWGKGSNGRHKHIGIVMDRSDERGVPLAMNNSSSTGTAVEKPVDYKQVEEYLSPPTSLA